MQYFSLEEIRKKWSDSGFQKYFKSTSWSLISRFLSMIISFIATTFIARNLGPSNYGQLSYAISFVGLFAFISTIGIDNILYRDLIKNPLQSNKLLGSAFVIKVVTGSFAAAICSIAAIFLVHNDVSKILIFILTGTFVFNSFQIINHEFQARVQSKYPSIITLIVIIILNILKVATILSHQGVIYLALILLLEPILYMIFYVYIYKTKLHGHITEWRYDKKITIQMLKDSWPLLFSTAFVLIYSRIDQVFIKHMIDSQSVGIYDSAVRIAEVWYIIPSILVTALFPAIINAKMTALSLYHQRLKKFGIFLIALATAISIPIMILAPFIMKTLYGSAFMGGVIVLQIYVWATVAIFLGALVLNYLIAENYRKILFFASLMPMVSNVLLNLLWIPQYGIKGAACATLVSYMFVPCSILFFKRTRKECFAIIKS